jgi:hypothetical protein
MAHLQQNHNTAGPPGRVMLLDELAGIVRDKIALDGVSPGKIAELIESRAGGPMVNRLFHAAVVVLLEQKARIAALTTKVTELADDLADALVSRRGGGR